MLSFSRSLGQDREGQISEPTAGPGASWTVTLQPFSEAARKTASRVRGMSRPPFGLQPE